MTSKVSTAYHGLLWVQHCEKYKGRWLSDETIVHKMNKAYPNIVDGGISQQDLNLCASPRGQGKFKGGLADLYTKSNNTGIFRYQANHCYCIHEKKKRNMWYYFIGVIGETPPQQPKNSDFPYLASCGMFLLNAETRQSTRRKAEDLKSDFGKNMEIASKKRKEVMF